uniref:RGS domain-containing protein n=1 Tax=Panagrolaimus superbus TaxID=310955 RepID=A0A914Y0V7_9BILA
MSMCFPLLRSRPLSKKTVVPAEPPPPPDPEPEHQEAAVTAPESEQHSRPSTSKEDTPLPTVVESPVTVESSPPNSTSSTGGRLSVDERRIIKTPPPPSSKALSRPPLGLPPDMDLIFDKEHSGNKAELELPSTDGLDYPRAASWSSCNVNEIMHDALGKQVFRCFLAQALAEENMTFWEKCEEFKKCKDNDALQAAVADTMESMGTYVNVSAPARAKLMEVAKGTKVDKKMIEPASKEIYKLLENDQLPRFRRSELYLGFLEKLLPRSYAEKWKLNFEALLGNQVGRHYFRRFLISIHAEENLKFWEAAIEFKHSKNKSAAMARSIYDQFLKEGIPNEVFLPHGVRNNLLRLIKEKEIDGTLFDDSIKYVEQVLRNDPYVRFLQSDTYKDLLSRLQ